MKKKRKLDKNVFHSLAMICQCGINILVPVGLMVWLGIFLDRKLGTSWLVILFFFLGAIAGFQNVYKMAKGIINDRQAKREK